MQDQIEEGQTIIPASTEDIMTSIQQPRIESTFVQHKLAGEVVSGPPTNTYNSSGAVNSDLDNETQLANFIANLPNMDMSAHDTPVKPVNWASANIVGASTNIVGASTNIVGASTNIVGASSNTVKGQAATRKPNHQSNLSSFLSANNPPTSNINNVIDTGTHNDFINSNMDTSDFNGGGHILGIGGNTRIKDDKSHMNNINAIPSPQIGGDFMSSYNSNINSHNKPVAKYGASGYGGASSYGAAGAVSSTAAYSQPNVDSNGNRYE
jgi:hypothetical protein